MSIRDNDINLKTSNNKVEIKETTKVNQYLISVSATNATFIELEVWFEIKNNIILLRQNNKWVNIKNIYKVEDNRILLAVIKLNVLK